MRVCPLETRPIEYDRSPDHLNDVGVLDLPSERLRRITGALGCSFQHLDLEQFARIKGIPNGAYCRNGNAFLPDVQDGLERMGLRSELGPAF